MNADLAHKLNCDDDGLGDIRRDLCARSNQLSARKSEDGYSIQNRNIYL
jgi:hypothetical protein